MTSAPQKKSPHSQSAQEVRVGLLVVCGILVTIVMIFLSDKISFDSYYTITAHLDSAGGLQQGSPVELSGIKIGTVEQLRTARGQNTKSAVVALLNINTAYTLYSSSELTVRTNGIFGDSYVSIAAPGDPIGQALPTNGAGEIIATPGLLGKLSGKGEQIVDAMVEILNADTTRDIKRLIKSSADTVDTAKALMANLNRSSEQLHSVLTHVQAVSTDIQRHMNTLGSQGSEVLAQVHGTVVGIRGLLEKIDDKSVRIAENLDASLASFAALSRTVNQLLNNNHGDITAAMHSIRTISGELEIIATDLRHGKGVIGKLLRSPDLAHDVDTIAISIKNISERIADHPEILIFGDSNEARAQANLKRKRNQQRRAFHQGNSSVLGTRTPTKTTPTDAIE